MSTTVTSKCPKMSRCKLFVTPGNLWAWQSGHRTSQNFALYSKYIQWQQPSNLANVCMIKYSVTTVELAI